MDDRQYFESQMSKEYPNATKNTIDFGYWAFCVGAEKYKTLWLQEQAKAMSAEAELEIMAAVAFGTKSQENILSVSQEDDRKKAMEYLVNYLKERNIQGAVLLAVLPEDYRLWLGDEPLIYHRYNQRIVKGFEAQEISAKVNNLIYKMSYHYPVRITEGQGTK